MVVITILGAVLLLVPVNLYRFGGRSRLENAANTMVAVVGASRSQAILDGHDVTLEIGSYKDDGGVVHWGHRWVITNMPAERSDKLDQETGKVKEKDERPKEQEWLTTTWSDLPDGVVVSGVSERKDDWNALRNDQPYGVRFGPDGGVEKAFAVRLESTGLEVSRENRTMTVVVNPLTAEASSYDGYHELPPQREENDFNK